MSQRILIVDDEPLVRSMLAGVLSGDGHSVSQAASAAEAFELLGHEPHALVLSDIRMPGANGMDVLRAVRRAHPGTDVVLMTGFASVDGAIDAMALGAADYLIKPLRAKEVLARIRAVLQRRRLERELHALQGELRSRYDMHNLVATSPRSAALAAAIQRIEDGRDAVLLYGEFGSGRKFVARAIHYSGARRQQTFACVECQAPPPHGLHVALFGTPGADGARRKRGLLDSPGLGTLHVAGLEHAPRETQVELARYLHDSNGRAAADGGDAAGTARLVISTETPLGELLDEGKVAPELAILRSATTVHVPALRQRLEDLPELVAAFCAEHARDHGRKLALGPGFAAALARADFPGNVAQLFAVLAHCATITVDGVLTVANLERSLHQSNLSPHRPIAEHLDDREYQLVLKAVQRNPRRLDQAARELGVSRTTLWRRMRKYGIKLATTA